MKATCGVENKNFKFLDFSYATAHFFCAEDYQKIETAIEKEAAKHLYRGLNLANCQFENTSLLKSTLELAVKAGFKKIIITTALWKAAEIAELKLFSAERKVGLTFEDSSGIPLGYTLNPDQYVQAKTAAIDFVSQMRKTPFNALKIFTDNFKRLPKTILDWGCGTGDDAIAFILKGCPLVYAVDAHEPSLEILKKRLQEAIKVYHNSKEIKGHIEIIMDEFLDAHPDLQHESIELFNTSFTLPYRTPAKFSTIFPQIVESIIQGGIFAGHLFSAPIGREKEGGLTYHTLEQARNLLEADFEILWIEEQTQNFQIVNGDNNGHTTSDDDPAKREFGTLIHFVATKNKA